MKYILLSLVVFLFIGCTTVVPPKSEFRVNPKFSSKKLEVSGCKEKSLKVGQAFSSNSLMSQNMNYAQGDSKQYIYSQSQWSTTPNKAITAEYLKLIRQMDVFASVQISKSRSKNDYILEINIEDFMQYFCEDASTSNSHVMISLTIIDTKTNSVIATKIFSARVDILELNANGGVSGLNIALASVLNQSSHWFSEVCK